MQIFFTFSKGGVKRDQKISEIFQTKKRYIYLRVFDIGNNTVKCLKPSKQILDLRIDKFDDISNKY